MSNRFVYALVTFLATSFLGMMFRNMVGISYIGASLPAAFLIGVTPLIFGWAAYYFTTPQDQRPKVPGAQPERLKLLMRLTGAFLLFCMVWIGIFWLLQSAYSACGLGYQQYYHGFPAKSGAFCRLLNPDNFPFVQEWVALALSMLRAGLAFVVFWALMRLTRTRLKTPHADTASKAETAQKPMGDKGREVRWRYILYFLFSVAILIETFVLNKFANGVVGPVATTIGNNAASMQVRGIDYVLWVLNPLVISAVFGLLAITKGFRRKRPDISRRYFLTIATIGLITQIVAFFWNVAPFMQCAASSYGCIPRTSLLVVCLISLVGMLIAVGIPLFLGLFRWPKDSANPAEARPELTKRVVLTLLIGLVTAWVPVVIVFLNGGWGSFIIFSPIILLTLTPLSLLLTHRNYEKRKLPWKIFFGELIFCVTWALIGFLFVNGGDTQESVGSIFTHWLAGTFGIGGEFMIRISGVVMLQAFTVSIALLVMLIGTSVKSQADTKKSRYAPIFYIALLAAAVLLPLLWFH